MHPGSASTTVTDEQSFSEWRALQKATDEPRAHLIADIVGHPQGMPTVEELDYMNPDRSDDAIRRHLATLVDVGVVEERTVPTGRRLRDFPYKFYGVTEEARALFDRNDLFPEGPWKRQYAAVEKTPRIRELETMPRPDA